MVNGIFFYTVSPFHSFLHFLERQQEKGSLLRLVTAEATSARASAARRRLAGFARFIWIV
jgi:hypothetical protein